MEPYQIQIGLMLAFVFAGIMFYLLSGWKGDAYAGSGSVRIRYCTPMRVMGWVMLILGFGFPVFLGILFVVAPPPGLGTVFGSIGAGLAVLLTGLYIWREYRNIFATISPEGVEQFSPWWGTKRITWDEIVNIDMYDAGYIVIHGKNGAKLEFKPQYWAGMDTLRTAIEKHATNAKKNPAWGHVMQGRRNGVTSYPSSKQYRFGKRCQDPLF